MDNFEYFVPAFILTAILAMYSISKSGWSDLAAKYRCNDNFHGINVGIISAKINSIRYSNSLRLKYNERGIYMQAIFIFRLFQPPILIPWKEIKDVKTQAMLFADLKQLMIGTPPIATISLRFSTYERIEEALKRYRG